MRDLHARRDAEGNICALICPMLECNKNGTLGIPTQLACHENPRECNKFNYTNRGVIPEDLYDKLIKLASINDCKRSLTKRKGRGKTNCNKKKSRRKKSRRSK